MNDPHQIAVFLGPSLPKENASIILEANYYPPVQRGDIYQLISTGIKTIILIDGVIPPHRPVWHREILDAMHEGIEVWGASGIGAIRALELQEYGMKGCGTIFEWYRQGIIQDDDEVLVNYTLNSHNFHCLSEALVNIRMTLSNATKDHLIPLEKSEQLIQYAKQVYCLERSYKSLLQSSILSLEETCTLNDYLTCHQIDLKQVDALQVLSKKAEFLRSENLSQEPTRPKPVISLQKHKTLMTGVSFNNQIISGYKAWQIISQNPESLNKMYVQLTQHCFIREWARQKQVELPQTEKERLRTEWEEEHSSNELKSNGLTQARYQELLSERLLVNWIIQKSPDYFRIQWNFDLAVQIESQIQNRIIEFAEKETLWRKLSQYEFIADWARLNGIEAPNCFVNSDLQSICNQSNREDIKNKVGKRVLVDWIVSKGASYFHVDWDFSLALFHELQITGQLAKILKGDN
ncbi:hypothetical protein H6G20_25545 [Desertifilum sp. FACHB-1129]|uniref:TfuA-like core domain-containing protein n=1 Tax=Desertifilum tharense IPPAS B-1220 TaxID=1781255 RepID=A0A1E5QE91_9CYAN|nr:MULTISPECIES: TfuA-like protein [Desertifilum]MDA0213570.1 TfuA-like protein [Cyanobacteria bacterium FC1]MBD2315036.1 hypothetical protein [Desertifilum sp. FACHB-1129]MBD2325174.1 hypothetical protein [Desertifilum sp. FACHB-866]MBD2335256.1 hypothetical protein [Desertifilum sp. FACHB-868]OEJ72976.1 hypothetical protein BH720_22170 [Desertifilum tharense IPPAS B-1220]